MSTTAAAIPHRLTVNGASFAYLKQGSGPALVIIHGVGGHKEDWQGVMAALAGLRTVYAVDMLGFGDSSRDAADLSMAAQAAAVKALLDKEGAASADVLGKIQDADAAITLVVDDIKVQRRLVFASFTLGSQAPKKLEIEAGKTQLLVLGSREYAVSVHDFADVIVGADTAQLTVAPK